MKSFVALTFLSAIASLASAQLKIDPNSVSSTTKQFWCFSQQTQCPLICLQTPGNSAETRSNDCNADQLTYSCVCSDGLSPNVTLYTQTLPFFICQEWQNQCVSNCGNNNACASSCRQDHPCGAQIPHSNTTSSAAMSSTSSAKVGATTVAGGDVIYTGLGGSQAAPTGDVAAAAAVASGNSANTNMRVAVLGAGQTFGMLAVVGFMFGGFAVFL